MNENVDVNGLNQQSGRDIADLSLVADVLVIGGGPAGTWAAWSAAAQGQTWF